MDAEGGYSAGKRLRSPWAVTSIAEARNPHRLPAVMRAYGVGHRRHARKTYRKSTNHILGLGLLHLISHAVLCGMSIAV
jgi:hypothetical protein